MQEILDFKYQERGKDNLYNQKHTHTRHFELLHIHSGSGVIMVNDRLFPIKKDTIVLINGIDTHCSVPDDPSQYVRSKLVISNSFVRDIANATSFLGVIQDLFMNTSGLCIELSPLETSMIDSEIKKIEETLSKESLYQKTNLMLSLFKILVCVHGNMNHDISTIHNNISEILYYLNEHIDQKIVLDDLCNHFHISKYYLCHTFKKTTGMTIFDYIFERRISIAKRKLIYTDDALSEIALSTGFNSFSYFSKTFKEYEGISPKQFRKEHQNW